MMCPNCGVTATLEHLQTSSQCSDAIRSFIGLYKRSKRTTVTRAGGRPPTMMACPRCGEQVTRNEAHRGHGCQKSA